MPRIHDDRSVAKANRFVDEHSDWAMISSLTRNVH